MIEFTVPLVPPSVNMYVRHTKSGRHYVSAEAKKFKADLGYFARGESLKAKAYEVEVFVYLGYKARADADNLWKCILDGLVEALVIDSDAKITDLILRKRRDRANPRTEIRIQPATVDPRCER